ncbi:MAG: hypothetical protein WC474_06365 [Hydrogenophilaceae bacterium]
MTDDAAAERLLREAMAEYPRDPVRADFLLDYACSQAADPLPFFRVLYKFHNRRRQFDRARDFADRALAEAARRGGLPAESAAWTRQHLGCLDPLLASQVLLALKALAFIALRRGEAPASTGYLDVLRRLDPEDGSGVSVVAALAESVGEMA